MFKKPTLYILIVNCNNKEVIWECLESIKKAGYISITIIVDNGSADDSVRAIGRNFPEVKIIELGENKGYAGGNNAGIKYLLAERAKYILILNPDTEINKKTISGLMKAMEEDKRIGIVGPKIYSLTNSSLISPPRRSPSNTSEVSLSPLCKRESCFWSCGGVIDPKRYSGGLIGLNEKDKGQFNKEKEVDYISGTCMLVRREVFERVGLFCEDYFIYYEDVELCVRAKRTGFKAVFVPEVTILHKESSSFGKDSPAHQYYMARNHFLFIERNAPLMIKMRELVRLPKTIYEHWQKKEKFALLGIEDYFLRRFGMYKPHVLQLN